MIKFLVDNASGVNSITLLISVAKTRVEKCLHYSYSCLKLRRAKGTKRKDFEPRQTWAVSCSSWHLGFQSLLVFGCSRPCQCNFLFTNLPVQTEYSLPEEWGPCIFSSAFLVPGTVSDTQCRFIKMLMEPNMCLLKECTVAKLVGFYTSSSKPNQMRLLVEIQTTMKVLVSGTLLLLETTFGNEQGHLVRFLEVS